MAYNNLGVLYKKEGKIDRAVEAYAKAIDINPEYENTYYNLANLYVRKKDFLKAESMNCSLPSNSPYFVAVTFNSQSSLNME